MAEKEYIERGAYYQQIDDLSKGKHGVYCAAINDCMNALDEQPAADVVEVRQIEKVKQEILARIDEFIAEYRGISQSYVDYFGGKAEAMEVARRLVNASLIDLCDSCDAKMDLPVCSDIECKPPYGDKSDCELYKNGYCGAKMDGERKEQK